MSQIMKPLAVDPAGHLTRAGVLVPFIPTPNMGGRLIEPEGIILHDTAGPSLRSATDWLRQAKAKASAHVVVDVDGAIVQMVPFDRVAWHAGPSSYEGRSGCNGFMLGIEMVNPGILDESGMAYYGHVYPASVPMTTPEHGKGRWMSYPEAQVEAVIAVCRALVAAYPSIQVVTTHWEVSPGRKVDPNPLFPLEEVRSRVLKGAPPWFLSAAAPDEAAAIAAVRARVDAKSDENYARPMQAAPADAVSEKPAGLWRLLKDSGSLKLLAGSVAAFVADWLDYLRSWLDSIWDLVLWTVGALPEITTEVKTTLTSSEEVAKWFKIDWGAILPKVALVVLVVVFWRVLANKRELEVLKKGQGPQS